MNGISALIKGPQRAPSPLCQVRICEPAALYAPGTQLSPDTRSWTPSLQNCED